MASDKASLLKQRLRRGSDSFRFDALIEGVSTIEEPVGAPAQIVQEAVPSVETAPIEAEVSTVIAEIRAPEPPNLVILEAATADEMRPEPDTEQVRIRWALTTLAERFARETAQMAAALAERDTDTAGAHLAHVNQALELLQPLDPTGDLARSLAISDSPPIGRTWPAPAWSFVEFSESPLSGLLPSNADERFVRDLLFSAWGVSAQ